MHLNSCLNSLLENRDHVVKTEMGQYLICDQEVLAIRRLKDLLRYVSRRDFDCIHKNEQIKVFSQFSILRILR